MKKATGKSRGKSQLFENGHALHRYLGGYGDFVSRLIMGISRITIIIGHRGYLPTFWVPLNLQVGSDKHATRLHSLVWLECNEGELGNAFALGARVKCKTRPLSIASFVVMSGIMLIPLYFGLPSWGGYSFTAMNTMSECPKKSLKKNVCILWLLRLFRGGNICKSS